MASADVITTILELVRDMLLYLLPVIAVLSGLTFIMTFFMNAVMGWGRRTFRE